MYLQKYPCRNSSQISIIVLDDLFEFNHFLNKTSTDYQYVQESLHVPEVFFLNFNYKITYNVVSLTTRCITFCYIIQIYILHFLLNHILLFINMILGGFIFE